MTERYSTALGDQLRNQLFAPRVFRDSIARYDRRTDGTEERAQLTWAVHGVCLECRCWAITAGRCLMCGMVYGNGRNNAIAEVAVALQIQLAKSIVFRGERS